MPPLAGDSLFVYGTLLFPEVLVALLDRVPGTAPASAPGWRVAALPGRPYPGLIPGGGPARGLLLTDLRQDEWRTLIAYEGELYDLRGLQLSNGRRSLAFVWSGGPVSEGDWDPKGFERHQLPRYMEGCAAWRHSRSSAGADHPGPP
jgi:Gamma-glutamyl cyclotransferase, AIG2-like